MTKAKRAFYGNNLALIHTAGFGALAVGAGRVVLRHLRSQAARESTVVDLGCGSGILAEQISMSGYAVVGIDLSAHLIAMARRRVSEGQFIVGSLYDVDLPPAAVVAMVGEVINYSFEGK